MAAPRSPHGATTEGTTARGPRALQFGFGERDVPTRHDLPRHRISIMVWSAQFFDMWKDPLRGPEGCCFFGREEGLKNMVAAEVQRAASRGLGFCETNPILPGLFSCGCDRAIGS